MFYEDISFQNNMIFNTEKINYIETYIYPSSTITVNHKFVNFFRKLIFLPLLSDEEVAVNGIFSVTIYFDGSSSKYFKFKSENDLNVFYKNLKMALDNP